MRVCWASAYQWSQEVERVGKTLNKYPGENGGKESLPKKKLPNKSPNNVLATVLMSKCTFSHFLQSVFLRLLSEKNTIQQPFI